MQYKICNQCGHENNKTANFCKSCGAPLENIIKTKEEKAEDVKQKLNETAKASADNISVAYILLLKPIFKAKIIIPILIIIFVLVFGDNIVKIYDGYKEEQKIEREKKEEEQRIEREKKEEEIRVAKEKEELDMIIAKQKKELEIIILKEKEERKIRLEREKEEREIRLAKEKEELEIRVAKAKQELKNNLAKEKRWIKRNTNKIYVDNKSKLIWEDDEDKVHYNSYIPQEDWLTELNYRAKNYMQTSGRTATTHCKKLVFAEKSDWRLPTKDELHGLYNQKNKVKRDLYKQYWSSTTLKGDEKLAWSVNFKNGYVTYSAKYLSRYVMCVRNRI